MSPRDRRLRRGLPLLLIVALSAVVAVVTITSGHSEDRKKAATFVGHWSNGDYVGMYELLDAASRERLSFTQFADAYRQAAETATITSIAPGDSSGSGDEVSVELKLVTGIFGSFTTPLQLHLRGEGDRRGIVWEPRIVFPALRAGEQLHSKTSPAPRGTILARNGRPLTDEALRSSLDTTLNRQVSGRRGGRLYAGSRVIASSQPVPGRDLRTSIDPEIQRAAVTALQGRYGGIAVLKPKTGEILALAGIATSALQPPGSTFKIITVSAALTDDIVSERSSFPVATQAVIEGIPLRNANGESCGGTLVQSFAESCNSVFAPLGVKVGAKRLVETAESFGFNRKLPLTGALTSTIPPADRIGDDLALGSSAIGQGQVQATTLQMASVAATIATHGRRHMPTLISANWRGESAQAARQRSEIHESESQAISTEVARKVERLMLAVVRSGTGTAAAISGVKVAGKTGTAELETTDGPGSDEEEEKDPDAPPSTDAWFTAYAPADQPRVAVAAMFVRAGAGGDVAAPAVREVLVAALKD